MDSLDWLVDTLPKSYPFFVGAGLTAVVSHLWRRFRNRIVLLRWETSYQALAVSGQDDRFGKIEVLYNGTGVDNVGLTTVTIANESNDDLTDLAVNLTYTDGTLIQISEGAVQGSANPLQLTTDFNETLKRYYELDSADPRRPGIFDRLTQRRDYHIPVLNRGGVAQITLLVQAPPGGQPLVNVSTDHLGVRMHTKRPRAEFYGESQNLTLMVGLLLSVVLLPLLLYLIVNPITLTLASFVVGMSVIVLGWLAIKGFRAIERLLGR